MLIQRMQGNSLMFKNTEVHFWNYGIRANIYWLKKQETGDMQLIYIASIHAN